MIGHCPMCDKDKELTEHHEKLLNGKGFVDYWQSNPAKIGMCDKCQTLFHRYIQYLEKITEDSPKPFKYE